MEGENEAMMMDEMAEEPMEMMSEKMMSEKMSEKSESKMSSEKPKKKKKPVPRPPPCDSDEESDTEVEMCCGGNVGGAGCGWNDDKTRDDDGCCICCPLRGGVLLICIATAVLFGLNVVTIGIYLFNEYFHWWYAIVGLLLLAPWLIAVAFFGVH